MQQFRWWHQFLIVVTAWTLLSGCASAYRKNMGGVLLNTYERLYITDYNTAWLSVLDALKSAPIEVSNREGGQIQTKWIDNTADKNFVDSFSGQDLYLKSQYRFKINLAKGFYDDRAVFRISVQKEQTIQHDVLEGWKPIETDGVEEKTLLYRLGRTINIRMRMEQIETKRVKDEASSDDF